MSDEQQPKIVSSGSNEDPGEIAAQMQYMYGPKLRVAVDQLSKKQLARIMKRLSMYPLADQEYSPTSKAENEVYLVMDRMMEAKFLLIMQQYASIVEKDQAAEALAAEQSQHEQNADQAKQVNGEQE